MRLLGYYIVHTIKNGIKKLFRTWVAVLLGFFVLCGAIGGIVGYTIGSLTDETDYDSSYGSSYEEDYTDEEWEEDITLTPEEKATAMVWVEMVAGAVILVVLLINVYVSDKSGTNIFTMPDVNFLFTAPMKPQSVLLFRVILQMGAQLVASVYILFQLPNMIINLGLDLWMVLAILGCWALTLVLGQILTVLCYTLIATHPRLRRFVRIGVFGVAGVLGLALYGVMQWRGLSLPAAAVWLYGSPYTRLVPGVGWLKGMIGFAAVGNWLMVAVCVLATAGLCALLVFFTWRIKADFYEDALQAATVKQETLNAAAEGRNVKRKKDRADRTRRDILRRGQGAAMFFYRGACNHHRFAFLGVFTGTGTTYLSLFLLAAALIRLFADGADTAPLLTIPALIVAFIAFFRNLGNPLEEDMRGNLLYLVPESAGKKLLCALLAGSYSTLLDVLPGLAVATLLLGAPALTALGWLLFILTMDFMISAVGLLLQMGLPASLPAQVHSLLQLMLKMLLILLPAILALVLSLALSLPAGLLIAAAVQLLLGLVFFLPAAKMLHEGSR